MRRTLAACVVLLATGPAWAADDYPHVYLKNDKLKVKVYLPDAQKGFYRGTRFDWAGVCGEVEFAGHKVFGPWKDTHDPTNHDDIVGPCEEFGIEKPLGYDEAKPGETFLKIGVGELEKPKEERYSFATKYKIVKPAEWKETKRNLDPQADALHIQWEAKASHPSGYGYEYSKRLIVAQSGAKVYVSHILKNTGSKPITTDFYNHNFFNVDADPVGPNYRFVFPFDLKTKEHRGKFEEMVLVDGGRLGFKKPIEDGFVMAGLTGYDARREGSFQLEHGPSGVSVQTSWNYPLSKFNIWGVKTTICPEPFMRIEGLKPGDFQNWALTYQFTPPPARNSALHRDLLGLDRLDLRQPHG